MELGPVLTSAGQRCENLSLIESLLQYRFATLNPLKARPGSGGLQNRSFAQPVSGCEAKLR